MSDQDHINTAEISGMCTLLLDTAFNTASKRKTPEATMIALTADLAAEIASLEAAHAELQQAAVKVTHEGAAPAKNFLAEKCIENNCPRSEDITELTDWLIEKEISVGIPDKTFAIFVSHLAQNVSVLEKSHTQLYQDAQKITFSDELVAVDSRIDSIAKSFNDLYFATYSHSDKPEARLAHYLTALAENAAALEKSHATLQKSARKITFTA